LKKYETVVILDEIAGENDGAEFQKEFKELINSNGGNVTEIISMGKRQFSYPIKKKKAGTYLDFKYEISSDKASLPKDKYKLDNRVLRLRTYLIK